MSRDAGDSPPPNPLIDDDSQAVGGTGSQTAPVTANREVLVSVRSLSFRRGSRVIFTSGAAA